MRTLMVALGLIVTLANSIFAEGNESLPHEIWPCDGLRSEVNRQNEPFILDGNMQEYVYKWRNAVWALKLIDEERHPTYGYWVYAQYLRNKYSDSIIGAAYIWCDLFAISSHFDQASEMKLVDMMWDQPKREAKCLKMN